MILIKNSQLDTQTIESLNTLVESNIPAKVAFQLMRIVKEVSSLVEDKAKLEKKIIDKYIEKDGEGNPVPAVDENGKNLPNAAKITNMSSFTQEIQELNSIETELPFDKINFEDLNLETARVKDLIKLEFLFN
jgi:hypothetical protein